MLRVQYPGFAVDGRELDLAVGEELAVPYEPFDLVGLEQTGDTAGELTHDAGPAFLHTRDVHTDAGGVDAVLLELVLRAVIELRRLEQRFRGDTAGIQTGPAERVSPVAVLPFVDTRHLQAVLRSTNCRNVAGRSRADDDDVVVVTHCFEFLDL